MWGLTVGSVFAFILCSYGSRAVEKSAFKVGFRMIYRVFLVYFFFADISSGYLDPCMKDSPFDWKLAAGHVNLLLGGLKLQLDMSETK